MVLDTEMEYIAVVRITVDEFAATGLIAGEEAEPTCTIFENPVPGCMAVAIYNWAGLAKIKAAGLEDRFVHVGEMP